METTRRSFLGGLAAASLPAGAIVASAAVPVAQTPQERFEYHLAELQKVAAEMDPLLSYWLVKREPHTDCALMITYFRDKCRYEGDGVYVMASNQRRYHVHQTGEKIDGHRAFRLTPLEGKGRCILTEPGFNTSMTGRIA